MSLMMETTFEAVAPDYLAGRGCPARRRAPGTVVERLSGERGAVLTWLATRAAALCHEGCVLRRVRYRQRRRVWVARIAYHTAPHWNERLDRQRSLVNDDAAIDQQGGMR